MLHIVDEGGLKRVTINRADKRNALSLEVLGALEDTFRELAGDPAHLAVVLTGAGERAFAAGGDLKELDSVRSEPAVRNMVEIGRGALDAIRNHPVPVIAHLNGDAIGGGAELALACDLRIFEPHARIGFAQGTLNITPAWGGGSDLFTLAGHSRALELLGTGRLLSATEAVVAGLADVINTDGTALEALVAELSRRKPQVMRAHKALSIALRPRDDAAVRALEDSHFVESWLHPDHWDAARAVLERIDRRSQRE